MPGPFFDDLLNASPTARPALLEGQWLHTGAPLSIAAINPVSVLEGGEEALAEFPAWLSWHADRHPGGAAIGYLSYEAARFFETLPLAPDASLPDLSFAYYPLIEEMNREESQPAVFETDFHPDLHTNFDKHGYADAVETIREYIAAGDIYQANLTCRFSAPLGGNSPQGIFRRLSLLNPPFGAYLKGLRRTVISNSPERFFRVRNGRIVASPVKGTMARPSDAAWDSERMKALLSSAKDLAENVMIVDLLRNDLGRICRYESIRAKMFEVQTLPHLFHLVSHVEGELLPGTGPVEILRSLFPCGSISGAPKLRAIEILAEIEGTPRGVSMGAIGLIKGRPGTAACEMDFSVAIRTLTVEDGTATFHAGGGIVYDSRADAEYEEMMLKAQPLLNALGVSGACESGLLRICAAPIRSD